MESVIFDILVERPLPVWRLTASIFIEAMYMPGKAKASRENF